MKQYTKLKENKILQRKFNYYLDLKNASIKNNLDIVLYIDKTSYNAMFHVQSDFTKNIEGLFVILNKDLKNKDMVNYFKTKKTLYTELNKFANFVAENKKQLGFILNHFKIKNTNQKS